MIGLVGAHRTGKTTLARLFAERQDVAFIETKTTQVFLDLGFDPKVEYDFKTRLMIQRKILESADKLYRGADRIFITDRTPIDMLAYTLADVTRTTVNGELEKELKAYSDDCIELTNRHFNTLMLVQPGIKMVETEGKAPVNYGYIEHLNHLMMGIVVSEAVKCNHYYIPRHMTDLEDRCSALELAVSRVEDKHLAQIEDGSIVVH